MENSLAGFVDQKNSTKCEFGEFNSMEKYNQLLLIRHIRQRQKLYKVVYYLFVMSTKVAKESRVRIRNTSFFA